MLISRKKIVIIFCSIILSIVFLILTFFIPYTTEKIYTISYPIADVIAQLRTPAKWANWETGIKEQCDLDSGRCVFVARYAEHKFSVVTPNKAVYITEKSPTIFDLEIKQNVFSSAHARVSVWPHQASPDSTILYSVYRVSLFKWFRFYIRNIENQLDPVYDLEKFIETPILYYGYPIEIRQVVDTIVLTNKKKVHKSKMFEALPVLFNQLNIVLNKNDLTVLQPPMIAFDTPDKDSTMVSTIYSVNKVLAFSKHDFNTFRMPKNGRMLVGRFKGKFSNRSALYQSMERYVADKNLSRLVSSYEKYTNGILPESNHSEIEIELYIPIY
jgi:effector-binding domain-containing protein